MTGFNPNIHLVDVKGPQTKAELSAMDEILLAIGGKVMTKNSRNGQIEPKVSLVFWLALAAILALIALAFFFGRLDGFSKGVEKGKEQSTIEQLADEVKSLKEQKIKAEQTEKNIRLAQELTEKEKEKEGKK